MPKKNWTQEDLQQAIVEVRHEKTIKGSARKYGMSEAMIRYKIKKRLSGETEDRQLGRPTTLSKEEMQLALCIRAMCNVGFRPTKEQIKDIVKEYVQLHELITPFKNDRQSKDWIRGFKNRNKLSLKKATMISSVRKSATGNPFIVYDFFDVIEDVIKKHNVPPSNIWNCNETGFPHDPSKCLVISVKGEVAYKVACGSGRENTITLAVASATGRVLDPLIIFSGKNFQSAWKGSNVLPNTFYAVSESGWMTTEIFAVVRFVSTACYRKTAAIDI